ncbi:ABC transporter permease [Candidatus Amarolinea aalborgensis]|uniref:ABC transporter permease n=1 Tax=Candidatus Amarolinea aalborgensis TaxID=2249329 RepID=UPI003BF95BD4
MYYLKLLKAFYRNAILVELEYRVNFLINVFMTAFWFAWTLVSVRIFYRFTDTIGGWTYPEALLVIGLFSCANAVIWGLVRPNVEKLVEGIRSGTFDFVLMKPVNSQFIASLRHLVIWQFSNLALGIAVLFIASPQLNRSISAGSWLLFALLLVCGLVIVYSIGLAVVSIAFWAVRIDNMIELFNSVFETARYPVDAFPGWARGLLTFVVPVAFITTVPAAVVIGKLTIWWGGAAVVLAVGSLVFSSAIWSYAVKHYASASS